MVRVYRFRDKVAIHLTVRSSSECGAFGVGDGQTVYLSPDVAKELGEALIECVKDVEDYRFIDSPFKTVEIEENN